MQRREIRKVFFQQCLAAWVLASAVVNVNAADTLVLDLPLNPARAQPSEPPVRRQPDFKRTSPEHLPYGSGYEARQGGRTGHGASGSARGGSGRRR